MTTDAPEPVMTDAPASVTTDAPAPVTTNAPASVPAPATVLAPVPAPVLAFPPAIEVRDLDWQQIRAAVDPPAIRARLRAAVEGMEALLDRDGGPGMLFDSDRENPNDRVIRVTATDARPPWIIGDLHGDLLALDASLAHIHCSDSAPPRVIFLGDFVDDEGFALEVLVRVFELILEAPERICVIAGNHDEALSFDGTKFASSVSPSDFSEHLNANLADEWVVRAGKVAMRLTAHVPRALFFPDGLLVAHGGFPLADLHPALEEKRDWNDPACLSDFVWARAHPKARKKLPNRFSRGSQFGYEDFADFCALTARLGRPITHFVRGHDHVEERYAIYPAYHEHPILTTVALSRRLPREAFGPQDRAPTLARVVPESLPQVYQLFVPAEIIEAVFPPSVPIAEATDDEAT
ncbi:hypothetical protein BH11MYX2_BH11MYX2_21650 [soil metagenome]